jgi:hypothetical protein
MEECKPIGTPFNANLKLLKFLDEEFENVQRKIEGVPYKARVGSLIYAMVSTNAMCSLWREDSRMLKNTSFGGVS